MSDKATGHGPSPLAIGIYLIMAAFGLGVVLYVGSSLASSSGSSGGVSMGQAGWSIAILVLVMIGVIAVIVAVTQGHSNIAAILAFLIIVFGLWFAFTQGGFERSARVTPPPSGGSSVTHTPPPPPAQARTRASPAKLKQDFCTLCAESSEGGRIALGCASRCP